MFIPRDCKTVMIKGGGETEAEPEPEESPASSPSGHVNIFANQNGPLDAFGGQ